MSTTPASSQLAPKQAIVIPIADRHNDYAYQVAKQLENGLSQRVNASSDRMNAKIRNAQNEKVPYMLVIGDREMEAAQVAPPQWRKPPAMSVADFLVLAKRKSKRKSDKKPRVCAAHETIKFLAGEFTGSLTVL